MYFNILTILASNRSSLLGVCIWYWGGESTVLRGSMESRGIDFGSRHAPDLMLAALRRWPNWHERQIGEFKK